MNISYVWASPKAPLSAPIGYATRILNTIRALKNMGNHVDLVTAGEVGPADFCYGQLKSRLPSSVLFKLKDTYSIFHDHRSYVRYKDRFASPTPDLIYERFVDFHQSTSIAAKQLGIPYLVEIHDPSEELSRYEPGHSSRTAVRIQERVASRADAIVVVSGALRDFLASKGLPPDKIHVVPNAVDERLFNTNSTKGVVEDEFRLRGKTVVGYVGSMMEQHGIDLLIRASERIIRDSNSVHFLLVGPDKGGRTLDLIRSKGRLRKYFTLTSAIEYERVPEHISAMDICVMPDSNWNGSPLKIFEYGAMGKAVVAPRYSPIEEVLVNGKTGLLTEVRNVPSLARIIVQLVNSAPLRQRLGENLRRRVLRSHTWDKNAERVMAICGSALSRRSAQEQMRFKQPTRARRRSQS